MELVNNFMSGSTGTITRTTGPTGFGPGNDTSGAAGVNFATLLDTQNTAQRSGVTQNEGEGNYAGLVDRFGMTDDGANYPETVKDGSDELKARTEEDIAALLALVNSLPTDKVIADSSDVELVTSKIKTEAKLPGVAEQGEMITRDDITLPKDEALSETSLETLVSNLPVDRVIPSDSGIDTYAGNISPAADSGIDTSTDKIFPSPGNSIEIATENITSTDDGIAVPHAKKISPADDIKVVRGEGEQSSPVPVISNQMPVSNEPEFVNERNGVDNNSYFATDIQNMTTDTVKNMEELVSALSADKVQLPSGEVELVTSKITTDAKPPSIVASSTVSDSSNGPVAVQQNATPASNGESVTVDTRNGADIDAIVKGALEAERNGGDVIKDTKVENTVDATKLSKEEILKSLEGQGKIVTSSSNTPNGTPSKDTNGPTGRAPENDSKMNSQTTENGPTGQKTTATAQETKTVFDDPAASIPMSFATQTSNNASTSTVATADNTNVPNETMMMRTTESTLSDDLTNLLSSRFPSKNGQLTIELDPEKLGKITINVSYESGHAAVSISATNQKTVELLTQSASAMANIIQQKTGQQTEVYIPNTQQSNTKQDMASGRESNENADQQSERQRNQQAQASNTVNSAAFLQQMRLGLV